MPVTVIIASAFFGAIAGALLPRVAYRMSVAFDAPARSACAECQMPFPPGVTGWVRFGSRCPGCHARLGPPTWSTVLSGALACGGLALSVRASLMLPVLLLAGIAGVLLSVIDAACMRLPDVIVLPLLGVSTAALLVVSMSTGSSTALVRALISAVALAGFYLALGFVAPSGVGLGDVKLALVLGLLLGWFGWGFVFAGAVVAHLIHGVTAVGMLAAGRANRKTLLPMGPALLAGAWFAIAVVPVVLASVGA